MKIAVTGATGLIGRKLIYELMLQGHQVIALARNPEKLPELPRQNVYTWEDVLIPETRIFRGCDAIIHLAGEAIADQPWTTERKRQIRESRVNGTKNIVRAISLLARDQRPRVFISASAIGCYKNSSENQDEATTPGDGFLPELCRDWESAALECDKLGIRTVLLRTGLVLAREGGLLSQTGPFILGDGQQWMSWIHIEDVIQLIQMALIVDSIHGPMNLTSPEPVTNTDFTKTYARIKKFPFTLPVPASVLKLVTGELSQTILSSQKILPQVAQASGYKFKFASLEDALKDLLVKDSILENHFSAKQFVPMDRSRVFSFFSKAENLEILTPPWLQFQIINKSTPEIGKGTLINYKLKIHGMPVRWRTLIKEWTPEKSFVDFQLKGPYKKWHHLHTFEEVDGGTLISDDVTFEIPGQIFGKLLLPLIRKDVQTIFNFRQKKINDLVSQGLLKS